MDIFYNKEDCKNIEYSFDDKNFYKKYNVINTWNGVEKLLKTYKQDNSKYTINNVKNTLHYLFNRYEDFFYCSIRNNKLKFYWIYNKNYKNPMVKYMKCKKIKPNPKWLDIGANIRTFDKKYNTIAIPWYYPEFKFLFTKLLEKYTIKDTNFVIGYKDRLYDKPNYDANEELGDYKKPKIINQLPIFSQNYNERYNDIPLPTADDIIRIFKIYTPPNCNNAYINIKLIEWNKKINKAVFRGSFTGPSISIHENQRLIVSHLSSSLLDAGITNYRGASRGRVNPITKQIEFLHKSYFITKPPLSHQQQAYYKYIIYIEGNVSAYRGAFLFSLGSVVIWVRPHKCHLWFEKHLIDNENCIMVNSNLDNLIEKLKWLHENDNIAEQIAINGKVLYDKYLTLNPIMEYTKSLFD